MPRCEGAVSLSSRSAAGATRHCQTYPCQRAGQKKKRPRQNQGSPIHCSQLIFASTDYRKLRHFIPFRRRTGRREVHSEFRTVALRVSHYDRRFIRVGRAQRFDFRSNYFRVASKIGLRNLIRRLTDFVIPQICVWRFAGPRRRSPRCCVTALPAGPKWSR